MNHITTSFDLIPDYGFKSSVIDPVDVGVDVVVGFNVAHSIECAYTWLIIFTVTHCVHSHSKGLWIGCGFYLCPRKRGRLWYPCMVPIVPRSDSNETILIFSEGTLHGCFRLKQMLLIFFNVLAAVQSHFAIDWVNILVLVFRNRQKEIRLNLLLFFMFDLFLLRFF